MQKILIVDDKPANLLTLRQTLSELEVDVVSAATGNEALVASLNHDFAVAILDVQMPEMDGFELAEILRSEPKTAHLPILFVSAIYREDHHIFRGYEAGAVDFMVKPYPPQVLLNKIRFFLKLDAQSRDLKDKLALEKSRSFLHSIITSVADAVFVEVNGTLTLVNPTAERLLGPAADLLGRPLTSLLEDPACLETLRDGERHATSLRSLNGDLIPVDLVLSTLEDRPGRVLLATDRSEAIRAAQTREELREQLFHAQRMESVGRMAGGVAHDLNNVLTIIQNCCGLLQHDQALSDRGRIDLEHAMNAAKQGEALVRQLLAFGRKQHMNPRALDLRTTVLDAFHMIERLMNAQIEIVVQQHDEPLIVEVDPDQLMQVLVNLSVNARDAMPDGGTLTVTTGESTDPDGQVWAFIEVSDNGKGIPADILDHIFEPFFTTKNASQGTGLGLSVVHGIVSQSDGTLSVQSKQDQGTTFRVGFRRSELAATVDEDISEHGLPDATETVLVVEDNPSVLRMVVRVLQRSGFEVLTASDLPKAVDAARSAASLDLLFTDVNLPETTGIEVAAAIRAIHPGLPVLLMSGNAQHLLAKGGMPEAPSSFLQKPFVPKKLISVVQETLRN